MHFEVLKTNKKFTPLGGAVFSKTEGLSFDDVTIAFFKNFVIIEFEFCSLQEINLMKHFVVGTYVPALIISDLRAFKVFRNC